MRHISSAHAPQQRHNRDATEAEARCPRTIPLVLAGFDLVGAGGNKARLWNRA